jgi:HAD superfamily hydrolase (TIGR01549 family)
MIKAFVFDFDGTLADSFLVIANIFNSLSKKYGFEKITNPNYYRDRSSLELANLLGISKLKLPFLVNDVRSEFKSKLGSVALSDGIREMLDALIKSGYTLGILTSNSKDNITEYLQKNNLEYFSFMHCGISLLGKAYAMKKMLKENGLVYSEVIYVGDEVRDIIAARKCRIKSVAVTWGFNSRAMLAESSPDFIIDKPEELLRLS